MSDFLKYRKIEKLQEIYEKSKEIAISFGAPLSSFAETDKKLSEIKDAAKNKIVGGVVHNSKHNFAGIAQDKFPNLLSIVERCRNLKNSIKTYKGWEESNLNLSDYLQFPCEIDEELANHISESTFPHYNTGEFTQGLDPEFSRDSYDESPEKEVFFYTSFSHIDGKFFYLGVLPEFRY
jgi:hypothetical protein